MRDVEAIWQDWEQHYSQYGIDPKSITRDGIINMEKYRSAKKRILFVLKDSNDFGGRDLREYFLIYPRKQIGHNLGRWAAGILNDFPDYEVANERERLHDSLKQTAVINIKKSTGGSWARATDLSFFANHDSRLLLRQIMEIDPQYIVSCGTLDQLIVLLDIDFSRFNQLQAGQIVRLVQPEAYLVPFRHPVRSGGSKSYEELRNLFNVHSQG